MKKIRLNGKAWLIIGFCVFVLLFYWVVREDWSESMLQTDPVNRDYVQELNAGGAVEQTFVNQTDVLKSLQIAVNPSSQTSFEETLSYTLTHGDTPAARGECPVSALMQDGQIVLEEPVRGLRGETLKLTLTSDGPIALWFGTTRSAGRIEVQVQTQEGTLKINGENAAGELVLRQTGVRTHATMRFFWPAALVLLALLLGVVLYTGRRRRSGNLCAFNRAYDLAQRYRFLLKTLVQRDFNVKYKASILGVLWSFLNPLLMTVVYFFVFSTIFRSSIEHFVIYLMSGIVLFNYFSDSTNLGMQSIVGNAGLITKVYIPKYIFPISKALSSSINLFISLVPLLVFMAIDGTGFHKSLLLVPVVLIFLIMFCMGISLLLSCMIVFFRDIQFLWSVLVTVWNFITPVFYPESIIPERFLPIYRLNPMYQYLSFMRSVTIQGIAPSPQTCLYCLIASLGVLALGLAVFRKHQHKFVLYL